MRRSANPDKSKSKSHKFAWFGHNRYVCDVIEDMRKCLESLNFSPMKGLIEEMQVMVNRMESAIKDQKDLVKLNDELSSARKAYKQLKLEYKALEKKVRPNQSNESED
jgi:hypothetical protein